MIRLLLQRLFSAATLVLAVGGLAHAAADPAAAWNALTPPQKEALAPLQKDWPSIDAQRRQKWLEVASRFPKMPADERLRVQERMAEWARLTPTERAQARLQFQEVRQLPAEERAAKWQAYRALPEAERQSLAQRAAPPARLASSADMATKARAASDVAASPAVSLGASAAGAGRVTPPIVVQARPGATTTTMSVRPVQSAQGKPAQGAPKISATAKHVDPATLLPKRSAQASTGGSDATAQP